MLLEYQMEDALEKKINKSSHIQQVKVQEGSSQSLFLEVKSALRKCQKKTYSVVNKMDSLSQNLCMMLRKKI